MLKIFSKKLGLEITFMFQNKRLELRNLFFSSKFQFGKKQFILNSQKYEAYTLDKIFNDFVI